MTPKRDAKAKPVPIKPFRSMSDSRIRAGIVGLGNISDIHAQAIAASRNGSLVAVCSGNDEKRSRFEEKYGVRGFGSYEEMLEDGGIDLVSICTPSGTHLDYGSRAAGAGKHIVVEKPIEVSLERAASLLRVCRSNGVKPAVIYQSRFTDDAIRMKKAIADGDIGEPFLVTATVKWFRSEEYFREAPWRGTLDLDGGGAVINQSIHTVDLVEWLLDEVESVQALKGTFTHPGIEGEDNAVAIFRYRSGIIGTFVASTSVVPPLPRQVDVHGNRGTAQLLDHRFRLFRSEEDLHAEGGESKASGGASPLADFAAEPHKRQFEAIFEALLNGDAPPVSGPESLRSLGFVSALYRSSETGKPVSPAELIRKVLID